MMSEKNRQTERDMESMKEALQADIANLRSLLESEKQRKDAAFEDCDKIDGEKRMAQDEVVQRGREIRDLNETKEMLQNRLKAVEIERDTLQERMQVTVSQMNQDINDLQKSIGIQNMKLEEAHAREEDLKRQLSNEREMIINRDRRIGDLESETVLLKKQIEDQNYQLAQIDGARADLNARFEDLRI